LGVITLKPEATSMFSLFCVPVCVVAQPINSAVHAAMILLSKICLIGFIGCILVVVNRFLTNASKGNPSGDLRTVQFAFVGETVLPEVVL
jgi:hypothetical protein